MSIGVNKDVNECRLNMVKARSDYKNVLRKSRLEYRQLETQKLEMHRYDNAKSYWKLLKKSCSSNSVKIFNAQGFADYFTAINNPDSRYFQPYEDILYFNQRYLNGKLDVMFEELNVQISMQENRKSVQLLKNGKSSGPDLFLNEFLKYGINSLISYLHTLLNKIFDTDSFQTLGVMALLSLCVKNEILEMLRTIEALLYLVLLVKVLLVFLIHG